MGGGLASFLLYDLTSFPSGEQTKQLCNPPNHFKVNISCTSVNGGAANNIEY
jgi:hypothetical protein